MRDLCNSRDIHTSVVHWVSYPNFAIAHHFMYVVPSRILRTPSVFDFLVRYQSNLGIFVEAFGAARSTSVEPFVRSPSWDDAAMAAHTLEPVLADENATNWCQEGAAH